jgi:hypothetical protein
MFSKKVLFFVVLTFFIFPLEVFSIVNGKNISENQLPEIKRLVLVPSSELINIDLINSYGRCSGVVISDHEILTAGHCVASSDGLMIPYVAYFDGEKLKTLKPLNVISDFIPENLPETINDGPVRGCSTKIFPLFETKTLDLAILVFASNTFNYYLEMDFNSHFIIGDKVNFFGFGIQTGSFEAQLPLPIISRNDLGTTTAQIGKIGYTRSATISAVGTGFADQGDSGGPVISNNKIIGILNSIEERCETEFGDDYALKNGFTKLSSTKVKTWITKNRN